MLSLLLSLISSINKKARGVVVTINNRVSFIIDDNEIDKADLGLKIRTFMITCFCFTKASFL